MGLLSFHDQSNILNRTVVDLLEATNTSSIAFVSILEYLRLEPLQKSLSKLLLRSFPPFLC
jgi:hypothetical protein